MQLLLDPEPEHRALGDVLDHDVALCFRRSRNVTGSARVVEQQVQNFTARHLFEPHFRVRPVERALHAA